MEDEGSCKSRWTWSFAFALLVYLHRKHCFGGSFPYLRNLRGQLLRLNSEAKAEKEENRTILLSDNNEDVYLNNFVHYSN
ncbi:uncharacterized protein G2W53_028978 [Senna tora]|uniref:Uncharacterized protein n=1 Tax=Senna tora TaxID=362788 RepID=A0A834TD73_9FABA|nr:uncharacterized protein G2W53_028978 [Senna tora]